MHVFDGQKLKGGSATIVVESEWKWGCYKGKSKRQRHTGKSACATNAKIEGEAAATKVKPSAQPVAAFSEELKQPEVAKDLQLLADFGLYVAIGGVEA